MITRSKRRFEYKRYHTTGDNIDKVDVQFTMADMNKFKVEEEVIVEDINHTLSLYNLNDLGTESEVQEAVAIVSELSSKYRHLHVEMKKIHQRIQNKTS